MSNSQSRTQRQADTYTRWAILAAGEGGGRIASRFFAASDNPSIEDRILVMNTNRADIRNTITRLERTLSNAEELGDHAFTFGPLDGVGNNFANGEMCADEGYQTIVEQIEASGITVAQAFLYTTTLGGGTGNGTVPYVIHELKTDPPITELQEDNMVHIALAAWPYDYEGPQRHFNAVCGLSRLLRWYDGSQNADMVLLVSNSTVAERFAEGETPSDRQNELVNERIKTAVDMLVAPGRETMGVMDVSDYVEQPSRIDAYHFTPGVATGIESFYDLEFMFEEAADNTFVPMDPTTSRALYAIVKAPRHLVEAGKYSETEVQRALSRWLDDNGYDAVEHRMETLTPVDRGTDTLDVMLLFGGFGLEELLESSVDDYRTHMDRELEGDGNDDSYLEPRQYRQIRDNLEAYLDHEVR